MNGEGWPPEPPEPPEAKQNFSRENPDNMPRGQGAEKGPSHGGRMHGGGPGNAPEPI